MARNSLLCADVPLRNYSLFKLTTTVIAQMRQIAGLEQNAYKQPYGQGCIKTNTATVTGRKAMY